MFAGDFGTCVVLDRQVVECFASAGDRRLAAQERVSVGYDLLMLGAYAESEAQLRSALAGAGSRLSARLRTLAHHNLVMAILRQGRVAEARALAKETFAAIHPSSLVMRGNTLAYLAEAVAAEGDLEEADRIACEAEQLLAGAPPIQVTASAIAAQVALRRGDAAEALRRARRAMDVVDRIGHGEEGEAAARLVLAEALLAVGDADAARPVLDEARRRLLAAAARIADPALRRSFVENVPEHARTLALAASVVG